MPLLFAILGVVKGPRPLKFIPALTACTSKRMKTGGFRTLRVLPPGNAVRGKNRKKLAEVTEVTSAKRSYLIASTGTYPTVLEMSLLST